jgi:hypothetical protein
MRSLYRLATVAAVSIGIATAGATAALAGPSGNASPEFKTNVSVTPKGQTCITVERANGDDVAQGCFESYGDHVIAYDKEADGLWVRVDWTTNYGRDGACHDKSSAGGPVDCNYNMDEDGKVKLQVELWDGSNRVAETRWEDCPWLQI